MLAPRIEVRAGDFLEGEARERVRQRLQAFVRSEIERRLAPLFAAQGLPLSGPGRGIAFQLAAALGVIPTEDVATTLRSLDKASRRALTRVGVRFGTESVYVEKLLGSDAVRLRALLWVVSQGQLSPKLPGGRRSGKAIAIDPEVPLSFYAAIGRRVVAGLALRPDRL
jgi:ATP-dependent RNA helicase SUPV3L1/SUV3